MSYATDFYILLEYVSVSATLPPLRCLYQLHFRHLPTKARQELCLRISNRSIVPNAHRLGHPQVCDMLAGAVEAEKVGVVGR
jgi:hypothetical protein